MKKRLIVLVAAVFVAMCLNMSLAVDKSYAETWPELLQRIKARYADFNRIVKDIVVVQDAIATTEAGDVTAELKVFKKGKKVRVETTTKMPRAANMPQGLQGMSLMKMIYIDDGVNKWVISPFVKGPQQIPPDDTKKFGEKDNWWSYISLDADVVGSENISGRECYIVEIREKSEFAPYDRIWIDKTDFVMVKAEAKNIVTGTIVSEFSDFRTVINNWKFAFRIDTSLEGQHTSTNMFRSFKVNTGLSDGLFDAFKVKMGPAGLQEMIKGMMPQE